MRELKFRAWDKVQGKYIEVVRMQFSLARTPILITQELSDKQLLTDPASMYAIEQYTGLKDKNGKEIYEGDIVNVIGIGIAQVIDSPSGEWMLYYKREPDEIKNGFACVVPKNKPSGLWKANTTSYIDVVGNIHEDSELLEGEE